LNQDKEKPFLRNNNLTATGRHLPYGITLFSHSVTYHPTQVNTPRLNPSQRPVLD